MNFVSTVLEWVEKHPAAGPVLLGAGLTVCGIVLVGLWKYLSSKVQRNSPYVGPVFYSFGPSYVVVAVHEYLPSSVPSGYIQIQHSRPDQWQEHISIKTTFLGLRHEIVPRDPDAHLVVVVRPTKDGGEKHVRFNR